MQIITPKYSFVQLNTIAEQLPYEVLPVIKNTDIAFQAIIDVTTDDGMPAPTSSIGDIVMAINIPLLVLANNPINDLPSFTASILKNYHTETLYFSKYRLSDNTILLYWPHGLINFIEAFPYGTCLRLGIDLAFSYPTASSSYNVRLTVLSNTFKKDVDLKYTSQLSYACNENNNGFNYCAGIVPNKIRLPLYLKSIPQFTDEESVYIKSDGTIKLLKSITKKEYQLVTEYLTVDVHEKIKILLSSDQVLIDGNAYKGGISKNGAYEIEPLDVPGDIDYAPAKAKVFATPYNVKNNNCSNC